MPFPFPNRMVNDVTEITPALLQSLGVNALLLDIDGTLLPENRDEIPQAHLDWVQRTKQAGIQMFLLSNSSREYRVRAFGKRMGLPWLHMARKPSRRGFLKAAAQMGRQPCEIASVGDQIFTDVWGARRSGMKSILVESSDVELWYFRPRRILEKPFMKEKQL